MSSPSPVRASRCGSNLLNLELKVLPSRPVLGFLPEFRRDPLAFLTSLYQRWGDFVRYRMGMQDVYFMAHPDLVRQVLVEQAHCFHKSRILQRARLLLGDGLLTSEGELHKRQRRMLQPAFHRDRIAAYGSTMVELADELQTGWRDGQVLDVAREMMRLALLIAGRTLFSADVAPYAARISQSLDTLLGMFDLMLMPFADFLLQLPLPSTRRFEEARRELDTVVYHLIAERRASGQDKGDLLSMLLLAQEEDGQGRMSDRQVRDEVMTILIAGHETTANALTWTWYLISQAPEVEERLHQEWRHVLGGRRPSMDDLPRLSWTEMVVAESLRLYPPAWGIGRKAIRETTISGAVIPAGAICVLPPYAIHRRPDYYPDPERFLPERWTAEARAERPRYAFLPFGAGPRMCIGERFAWMELLLVLPTIGQNWRLTLAPDQTVVPQARITLRPRYGMRMRLERRDDTVADAPRSVGASAPK